METALVVAVEGLPPEISAWRWRLDPSAEAGVPDHITVLYPFVPSDQITNDVINRVAAAVGQVPAFGFNLAEVRWLGEEVMWLAPDPDDPFRRLTLLVQAAFGTAPYGGVYDDVTPHLTIAYQADLEQMKSAAAAAASYLPIRARADEVRLLRQVDERWSEVHRFALGYPV